jgi:hypothetical protein
VNGPRCFNRITPRVLTRVTISALVAIVGDPVTISTGARATNPPDNVPISLSTNNNDDDDGSVKHVDTSTRSSHVTRLLTFCPGSWKKKKKRIVRAKITGGRCRATDSFSERREHAIDNGNNANEIINNK